MVQRPCWSARSWMVPVSSGRATGGAGSPAVGMLMESLAGVSITSRRPRRSATDASDAVAAVRQPAARPGRSGSSSQRVDKPGGRHAQRVATDRQQRHEVADPSDEGQPRRCPVAAGARPAPHARIGRRRSGRRGPAGAAVEGVPGWRGRGRAAATEGAEDGDRRRAALEGAHGPRARCPTRPCRTGRGRSARPPPRAPRRRPRRASRRRRPTDRWPGSSAGAWRAPPSAATTNGSGDSQPGHASRFLARGDPSASTIASRLQVDATESHRPRRTCDPRGDIGPCRHLTRC